MGPTYVAQYRQPGLARANDLDRRADEAYATSAEAGKTADDYVRTTVFLATVLFLVISTQFPLRSIRYGLVGLGAVLLVVLGGSVPLATQRWRATSSRR